MKAPWTCLPPVNSHSHPCARGTDAHHSSIILSHEALEKEIFSQQVSYWSAMHSILRALWALVSNAQCPSDGPEGPVCEQKLVSNTWPENSDRVASNLAELHKNPPLLPPSIQFYLSLCTKKPCCVHNCFPLYKNVCTSFFHPFLAH